MDGQETGTFTILTFTHLAGADEALHRTCEDLGEPAWEYVSYDHASGRSDLGLANGVAAEAASMLTAAGIAFTSRTCAVPAGIVGEGHRDGYLDAHDRSEMAAFAAAATDLDTWLSMGERLKQKSLD